MDQERKPRSHHPLHHTVHEIVSKVFFATCKLTVLFCRFDCCYIFFILTKYIKKKLRQPQLIITLFYNTHTHKRAIKYNYK